MNVAKAKLLVVRRHWTQVGEQRERERTVKLIEEVFALVKGGNK